MISKHEHGFYLIRILVVLALANLFLYALGSFATAIRLAKATLLNNKNHTTLQSLTSNEISPQIDEKHLKCTNNFLADNIRFTKCEEKSTRKELLFLKEEYE